MKNVLQECRKKMGDGASLRAGYPFRMACREKKVTTPLRLVSEGSRVRVVSLNGGRGFLDRMAGVGIRIGGSVLVIQNRMDGKVLLGVEGTRLFLGGGMAQKINVVMDEMNQEET